MSTLRAGAAEVRVTVSQVTVAMRAYFSSYHLHAAKAWTKRAEDIEASYSGPPRFDIELRSVVSGAVICSVAFLEAAINELYQDAVDRHLGYCGPLAADKRDILVGLWAPARGRDVGLMKKYEAALEAAGTRGLARGRTPYQDAALVIALRNELVHYRPETLTAASTTRVQRKLQGRFPPSALMRGAGNPWFPDHCLGAGAAAWAVNSSVAFADAFFERLGVVPNSQRVTF